LVPFSLCASRVFCVRVYIFSRSAYLACIAHILCAHFIYMIPCLSSLTYPRSVHRFPGTAHMGAGSTGGIATVLGGVQMVRRQVFVWLLPIHALPLLYLGT